MVKKIFKVLLVLTLLLTFIYQDMDVYGEDIADDFYGRWSCNVNSQSLKDSLSKYMYDMKAQIEKSQGAKIPDDVWNMQMQAFNKSMEAAIKEAVAQSFVMDIQSVNGGILVQSINSDGSKTKASQVRGSDKTLYITSPSINEQGIKVEMLTTMSLTSSNSASIEMQVNMVQNGTSIPMKLTGSGNKTESYSESEEPEPEAVEEIEEVEVLNIIITGENGKELENSYMYLGKDEKKKLTYKLYPYGAKKGDLEFEWYSNDESVVTVTQDGLIKGIDYGETNIGLWCPGKDYIQDTITIIVEPKTKIEDISITGARDGDIMNIGETIKLNYKVMPENADLESLGNLIWSSDNPKIASVNQNGTVTGSGEGTATIKLQLEDNEEIYSIVLLKIEPSFAGDKEKQDYEDLKEKQDKTFEDLEKLLDKIAQNNPNFDSLDFDNELGNLKKIINKNTQIDENTEINSDTIKKMYHLNKKEIEKNVDKLFEQIGKKVPSADILGELVKKSIGDEFTQLYDKGKKDDKTIKNQLYSTFSSSKEYGDNPMIVAGDAFCKKLLNNVDKTKALSKLASLPMNMAVSHQKNAYKKEYDLIVGMVKNYKRQGLSIDESAEKVKSDLKNSYDELGEVITSYEEGIEKGDLKKVLLASGYVSNREQTDRYSKGQYASIDDRFDKYIELSKLNLEY